MTALNGKPRNTPTVPSQYKIEELTRELSDARNECNSLEWRNYYTLKTVDDRTHDLSNVTSQLTRRVERLLKAEQELRDLRRRFDKSQEKLAEEEKRRMKIGQELKDTKASFLKTVNALKSTISEMRYDAARKSESSKGVLEAFNEKVTEIKCLKAAEERALKDNETLKTERDQLIKDYQKHRLDYDELLDRNESCEDTCEEALDRPEEE